MIKKLNHWKCGMDSKGMKVNMNKTKGMISAIKLQAGTPQCDVCQHGRCYRL